VCSTFSSSAPGGGVCEVFFAVAQAQPLAASGDVEMQPEEALEARQLRAGKNQALFRELNEQLEGLAERLAEAAGTPLRDFVCECARTDCVDRVEITSSEYEAVRRVPTHFVVRPGHGFDDFERVVQETDRFTIVEKFGAGVAVAVSLDPRKRDRER
jgi:hypothetical protein